MNQTLTKYSKQMVFNHAHDVTLEMEMNTVLYK